jgi:hypothetical protein
MAQAIANCGAGLLGPDAKMPPDVGAELDTRMGFPQRQIVAVGPDGTPADTPTTPPQPGQAPTDQPPTDTPPAGAAP